MEFGSGASTFFFSLRCEKLISFEHDESWYKVVKGTLDANNINNVQYHLLPRPYSEFVPDIIESTGESDFSIISIDGRDRVLCLKKCLELNLLGSRGIFLLDNTERVSGQSKQYAEYISILKNDFNLIHFEQITPIDRTGWKAPHRWITTIAYAKNLEFTSKGFLL